MIKTIVVVMVLATSVLSANSDCVKKSIFDDMAAGGLIGYLAEISIVGSAAGPIGMLVGLAGGAIVYTVVRDRDGE